MFTDNTEMTTERTTLHPVIEDDVTIYAGATLIGPIRIGRGSVIGGNVWLTQDVPPLSNIPKPSLRTNFLGMALGSD